MLGRVQKTSRWSAERRGVGSLRRRALASKVRARVRSCTHTGCRRSIRAPIGAPPAPRRGGEWKSKPRVTKNKKKGAVSGTQEKNKKGKRGRHRENRWRRRQTLFDSGVTWRSYERGADQPGRTRRAQAPRIWPLSAMVGERDMTLATRQPRLRIGIDTGGTFTDIVSVDSGSGAMRVTKVASTPTHPAIGLVRGVRAILQAARRSPPRGAGPAPRPPGATHALLPGPIRALRLIL